MLLCLFLFYTYLVEKSLPIIYNVRVDVNGTNNKPGCIIGLGSCHTFGYVLDSLDRHWNYSGNHFSVIISYSHQVDEVVSFSPFYAIYEVYDIRMRLIGIGKPILYMNNITLMWFRSGFFSIDNLILHNIGNMVFQFTWIVKFTNSNLIYAGSVIVDTINTLMLSDCLLKSNILTSKPSAFSLHNVSNVVINDCRFHSLNVVESVFDIELNGSTVRIVKSTFEEITGSILEISRTKAHAPNTIEINNSSFIKNVVSQRDYLITFNWHTSVFTDIFIDYINVGISDYITVANTIFSENILKFMYNAYKSSILNIACPLGGWYCESYLTVMLLNNTFSNNLGTGLSLYGIAVNLNSVNFTNNTGLFAAGMSIQTKFTVQMQDVFFINNTAIFGGVIFIQSNGGCPNFHFKTNASVDIHFSENNEIPNFYLDNARCAKAPNIQTFDITKIVTGPSSLKLNGGNNSTFIFPGQQLVFPVAVIDGLGHNTTSCFALPTLECGLGKPTFNCIVGNVTLQLKSQGFLFLKTSENFLSGLHLASSHEFVYQDHSRNIRIKFTCTKTMISGYLNINLTTCPLGYVFKSLNEGGVCQCVENGNLKCDINKGIACVRRGYWYGTMKINNELINTTIKCSPPFCAHSESCPLDGYRDTFVKLPTTQDEQCGDLYGGVTCRGCQSQATFTFGAGKCISLSNCEGWMPYAIIGIAIIFEIVLVIFILLFLKHNTRSGIGYLYGPLFFLAVYKLLASSIVDPISALEIIVSLYHSIIFLDLSIFGKIQWCFFPNANHIFLYSLRFTGPFITLVVLLVVVFITKHFHRTMLKIFTSPIQGMCLLLVLSFWSVSNTCIEIIKPTITNHGWRVAIEPKEEYLANKYHIIFWTLSVVLILFLYIPFIFVLLFSQCLRMKMNLFRIQPLLDAFQSSYKEKFQWFSGVYLVVWIILNINLPLFVFIAILNAVCLLHFLIQPHKNKWLNISDTLLLSILIYLSFLINHDTTNKETLMIYILTILPLLYILIGGTCFTLGSLCMNIIKTKNKGTQNLINPCRKNVFDSENRNIHEGVNTTCTEINPFREPLILEDMIKDT